jgi:hypothetical protein
VVRGLGVKITEDQADMHYGDYDFLADGAIGRNTITERWDERCDRPR